jgi:glycosyltransferase involved in cell wall biosynthesis
VTSPTRGLLDALVQRYALDFELSAVIPNPMPVADRPAIWDPERAKRAQLLAVGRFDLCKGADVVLRAFALAVDRQPELTLVMAGPDSGLVHADGNVIRFDDFIRSEISPQARSHITFLGSQPPSRISELRLESGVAVVGSRFETFAYTIAEAMAVGMPLLTSATFGARELIRDGRDGRIVPIADVDRMAQAMIDLSAMPDKLIEFGRSAYRRASELLSPKVAARQTVEIYRRAIQRASAA